MTAWLLVYLFAGDPAQHRVAVYESRAECELAGLRLKAVTSYAITTSCQRVPDGSEVRHE